MAKGRLTKSEVTRALRAVADAGEKVERFEIDQEGRVIIYIAGREPRALDELDQELEEFEARHGKD
jgi:hypothetical protein